MEQKKIDKMGRYVYIALMIVAAAIVLTLFVLLSGYYSSNPTREFDTTCIASYGYVCKYALISNVNGTVSMTYAQFTGSAQYNVSLVCAAAENKNGSPYVASGGFPNATYMDTLNAGQAVAVTGLLCYDKSGNLVHGPLPSGEKFNFTLWETYHNENMTQASTLVTAHMQFVSG